MTYTKPGIDALMAVVTDGPARRAADVIAVIEDAVTEPSFGGVGHEIDCSALCSLLLAGMLRDEPTKTKRDGVAVRIKDIAANALAAMRSGIGRDADPTIFDVQAPDSNERDQQIRRLIDWYESNKDRLGWDVTDQKLVLNKI